MAGLAVKLSPGPAKQADPRVIPLPLDDAATAERVKAAPTSEQAWRTLGLPGDVDYTTELVAAANAVLPIGDSIAKGLVAFGALDTDADVPDGWVDRMVTLYVQELEAYWAMDQIAYESSRVHGWTVRTDEPWSDIAAERIAYRARLVAEESKPKAPALWWDQAHRHLSDAEADGDAEWVKGEGRALVVAAVGRRFANWRTGRPS